MIINLILLIKQLINLQGVYIIIYIGCHISDDDVPYT